MHRKDIFGRKKEILQWIAENKSKSFICRQIHCKLSTFNIYLKKMGINYLGNQGNKGYRNNKKIGALDYIKQKNVNAYRLKIKLLEDGIKEHKCERCGGTQWLGGKIPLEIHHKDGNRYNNVLDNIELLCPNCHSLENNHCGLSLKKIESIKFFCEKCGKVRSRSSKSHLCKKCFDKTQRRTNRPDRDVLLKQIKEFGYRGTARLYGVSDNSIRNWIK